MPGIADRVEQLEAEYAAIHDSLHACHKGFNCLEWQLTLEGHGSEAEQLRAAHQDLARHCPECGPGKIEY